MNKRIMLILALGFSFAPPAFAATPEITMPGEMKVSQHKPQGTRCALQDQKNLAAEEGGFEQANGGRIRAGGVH